MRSPFNALLLSTLLFAVPALADEDEEQTSSESSEEEPLAASLSLTRASSSFETQFLDGARTRTSDDSSNHYRHGKCTNLELLAAFLSEQGIARTKDQLKGDIQEVAENTEVFIGKESQQKAWGVGTRHKDVASDAMALFAGNEKKLAEKNCGCQIGTSGSHAVVVWSPNGTEQAVPYKRRGGSIAIHELVHLVLEHEGITSIELHHRFMKYMGWGDAAVGWSPKAGKCATGGASATADEETEDSASEE